MIRGGVLVLAWELDMFIAVVILWQLIFGKVTNEKVMVSYFHCFLFGRYGWPKNVDILRSLSTLE